MILRILTFIIGILGTLYMAILYKSTGLLFVFYAEILMGIIMFLIDLILFLKIKAKIIGSSSIDKDGQVRFELIIENKSILPGGKVSLELICTDAYTGKYKKVSIRQCCSGRSVEKHQYSFKEKDEDVLPGKYIVSIKKMSVYDYLGIFKITRYMKNENSEMVLVAEDNDAEYADKVYAEATELKSIKKNSAGEFSNVREYRNGDKLNNIHWKISSKSDELYVKEFADGSKNYHYYYIETRPLNRNEIAEQFQKWIAVGNKVVENGDILVFIWYDPETKYVERSSVSNEDELFEALCRINVFESKRRSERKSLIVDKDMLIEMSQGYLFLREGK